MVQTDALRSRIARAIPRRFSLRALMLLIVATAAGLAYWRQPVEMSVAVTRLGPINYSCFAPISNNVVREVRTYRRGWPGQMLQDGLTTSYDSEGNKIVEATWQYGELHGPYRRFDQHGYQYETGQFHHGKHHGSWVSQVGHALNITSTPLFHELEVSPQHRVIAVEFDNGKILREVYQPKPAESQYRVCEHLLSGVDILTVWDREGAQKLDEVRYFQHRRDGQAHGWYPHGGRRYSGRWQSDRAIGDWTLWDEAGQVLEVLSFSDGQLVTRGGKPVPHFPDVLSVTRRQSDAIAIRLTEQLSQPLEFSASLLLGDYSEPDLEDLWNPPPHLGNSRPSVWMLTLALRAQVDPRVSEKQLQSTHFDWRYDSIPAEAALHFALRPLGLACEYRYQQLWITTHEAAASWERSPNFLSEEFPTPLEAVAMWSRSPGVSLPGEPPSPVLQSLDKGHNCSDGICSLRKLVDAWQRTHGIGIQLCDAPDATQSLEALEVNTPAFELTLRSALGTLCELHNLQCKLRGDELVISAREPAEAIASEE